MNVLITGASRGIGYALAEEFTRRDASHLFLVSRSEAGLEDLRKDCLAIDAKTKIILSDNASDSKYTKNARPSIIYSGLALMIMNYCILPALSHFFGYQEVNFNLPGEFWIAWGGVVGAYSFGRSKEKGKNK